MKIIAGLGNPGVQYETNRHNAGFLAIDRLIEKWHAAGPVNKYLGKVFQSSYLDQQILLVKPTTFMNLSGRCISAIYGFYQCKPADLIVIHDDLALPPMILRFKTGGGTGGHNGLKSIDECIGKDNTAYHRIRLGIGHPSRAAAVDLGDRVTQSSGGTISPADYVLQNFTDDELKSLDGVLDQVCEGVELILKGQIQIAMNKFHRFQQE
jgi:PTH1 family peptidyl-tRNA hydrolase